MSPTIPATLAFVFSADFSQVLLIRKSKPPKHAGLLNGLGGKCEADESHAECVVREVEEEAGLHIPLEQWISIGTLAWEEWEVSIWATTLADEVPEKFPEDQVAWYPANPVPEKVLTNLNWLIPLAIDTLQKQSSGGTAPQVQVRYV